MCVCVCVCVFVQYTLKKEARYECRVLVTGLAVVKDFMLVTDVQQSCMFFKYNVSIHTLTQACNRDGIVQQSCMFFKYNVSTQTCA